MGEHESIRKPRGKGSGAPSGGPDAVSRAPAASPLAPAWLAPTAAPFAIGGVQRKVAIGQSNDAYEREADHVANRVTSGARVPPGAISPLGAAPSHVGQMAAKPDEKKTDDKGAPPVQRAARPEDREKDPHTAAAHLQRESMPDQKKDAEPKYRPEDKKKEEKVPGIQRQSKPEEKKKKDEKPAPVQKQSKPEDKKKDAKPAPVQKQSKPEEKKEDGKPAPVQKQSKPEEKKKDEKAAPVQKQSKPDEKKEDGKPAPVQKQSKPDEKKKDEKAAPVQKQSKPEDKKKDAKPAPVQKQSKPEEKKEDGKPAPVQKQSKPDEKKKDEKPAPVQKQSKPEEKKKDEKPAPVQKQSKPDEKKKKDEKPAPVQKQSKPDEKKKKDEKPAPVQKQSKPEDKKKKEVPGTLPAQRAEMPEKEKDHGTVQASRGAAGSAGAMESAASHAIATKGPGEPLNSGTRNTLESRMGTDLSDVRVHSDSGAHSAAEALNARAFTHQSDIWLGRGESQHNVGLMAHEATHVVQQTGSVHRQLVQRAAPAKTAPAAPEATPTVNWDYESKKGKGKVKKGSRMEIPVLKVPNFKKALTPAPVTLPKKTGEQRPDDQATTWDSNAKKGSGLKDKLDEKLKTDKAIQGKISGQDAYVLKVGRRDFYVIGNRTVLVNKLVRPSWDETGKSTLFQVDHKQELQLGGAEGIENLWLLEAKANMSSGRNIKGEKEARIQALLKEAADAGVWKGDPPDLETVRASYTVTFNKVEGGLPSEGDPNPPHYELNDIAEKASQLDPVKALNKNDVPIDLLGSPTEIVVYSNPAGGRPHRIQDWPKNAASKSVDFKFGNFFKVTKVNFDRNTKKGSIEGDVYKDSKLIKEVKMGPVPLEPMDVVEFGGYVSQAKLTTSIQHELKQLSPIEMSHLELTDEGLVGRGKVLPTVPPFDKAGIDLVIDGDNIYLSKVFSADNLNFPGPVKVTGASVEVFGGTPGVGVRGDAFFEIASVGKGKVSGKAAMGQGVSLSGTFQFDPALFDPPAEFTIDYTNGKFSGHGALSIKSGRIRGIQSASLTGSFADDVIDLKGTVKPDIPAVEEASLSVNYSKEAGLVIGGDLQVKKGIPGISGGTIHAQVSKKPGADNYTVKASGEVEPNIPGVSSKLAVSYDDGLFDASATAGYEKGMLKGSLTVGATNRPVTDGKPSGEPPPKSDKISVYGTGSLTLKLAPWLAATAEVMLKPNGELVVTGKIGLPSALDIFPEKKLDKNIFTIKVDIPIVGVSVLGHNIGIFVSIGGGLDLSAGIGPGQLTELGLEVTYNPSNEAETHVSGGAKLHIPAHAGLRLFVKGALGVGIPIVDAEAGIEIGGQLGLEGALDAGVQVDWTPQKGLVLDASAEIYAEPKFRFDITGFVNVSADLLFKTIDLYNKRWELAAVEYGSGLKFGLKLPIHYEEGKPFELSFSDVQFEYPNIDAMDVLKGLIDKIA